ncbi:uncharacterized protein LOC107641860 [Arachis ipaensis]|uniref:uncharacterized protein LOC107641860 n=1 Tax=Arachis ipaensis TaxID=130454 RepID=UPI0007AF8177|nr:uncharacterized protein LOC107641860 [Arachis ipaensis]XP_025650914.1 uncharacterized protein LOC112747086 [Arachis hypogaea]QHO12224.1 uncharacterized protein DS421_15g505060 [Arachis hypogaea]
MKFMKNLFKRRASSKSKESSKAEIHGDVLIDDDSKEMDQESIQEMESSLELYSLCESNEEKRKNKTVVTRRSCNLCMYEEDSWQVLVAKPIKKEENKEFFEALSFWKEQENREICRHEK